MWRGEAMSGAVQTQPVRSAPARREHGSFPEMGTLPLMSAIEQMGFMPGLKDVMTDIAKSTLRPPSSSTIEDRFDSRVVHH
jgi:hypothetical protein